MQLCSDHISQEALCFRIACLQNYFVLTIIKNNSAVILAIYLIQLRDALDKEAEVTALTSQGSHAVCDSPDMSEDREFIEQQQYIRIRTTIAVLLRLSLKIP